MSDATGDTIQSHEWYRDLLGAYALGALLPDEAAALEAHLASCAECRQELRLLRRGVKAYALSAEEREPSPDLRNRVWAAIWTDPEVRPVPQAEPAPEPISITDARTRRRVSSKPPWAAIAAVLAVALIAGLLAWNLSLRGDEPGETGTVIGHLAAAPDAPDQASGGEVRYLEDEDVILLSLHDLPPLGEGEVYQLWLIDGDSVAPSVTFGPNENPDEPTRVAVAADPARFDTLAITREPGPLGSTAPTTKPFLLGNA